MNFLLGVGGGFLLAVLWMDLMFDVLVFGEGRERGKSISEDRLAQIAAYYRRVTTTARPMNYLVGLVMAAMVAILVTRLVAGGSSLVDAISLALCGIPIGLALLRIFPNAVRLGARSDGDVEQSRLAREICSAHLVCFAAMSAFVVLRWTAGS